MQLYGQGTIRGTDEATNEQRNDNIVDCGKSGDLLAELWNSDVITS